MTMQQFISALLLLPLTAAAGAAHTPQAEAWPTVTIHNQAYYELDTLSTFYKLNASENKKNTAQHIIRNSAFSLALTPGSREALISGYRVQLSAAIRKNEEGKLLIAQTDVVKLIDPILRPTYITERRDVQTVILDPGHGGADTGHRSPHLTESDFTLKLARELAEALKKQGLQVILTRSTPYGAGDAERVEIAKKAHSAIFISLHLNSGRSDVSGVETYTIAPATPQNRALEGNRHDAANAALGFALHSHLVAASQAPDRACRRVRYSLLNTLNCPAAIVMPGYATHEKEAALLATDAYRAELVQALCNGILAFKKAIRHGAAITIPTPPKTEDAPPTPGNTTKATPPDKPKNTAGDKSTKPRNSAQNRNKRKPARPRRRR